MKAEEHGSAIATRLLECAVTAVVVLLAADGIRAVFGPMWRFMSLLFGN